MFNYPRLVLKVGVLTLLFLIGFFFIFPPERPLTHLHDHEKEPHEPHTRISQDVQQDTTVIPDENGVVEEYFQEYMREEEGGDKNHTSSLSESEMKERLGKICEYYAHICEKIQREASYTIPERYTYTLLIVYSIKRMDEERKLPTSTNLASVIAYIKMFKDPKSRRGSATTTRVKMNTQKIASYQEFLEVFIHEVGGHIQDLGVITDYFSSALHPDYTEFGEPKFGMNDRSLKFYKISWLDENTRRSDATYKDFVSGYAMKDIFEEKAEFANAWINHHDLLKELAKKNDKIQQKYELFEELFGSRKLRTDSKTLKDFNSNERVFDSTKSWKNTK